MRSEGASVLPSATVLRAGHGAAPRSFVRSFIQSVLTECPVREVTGRQGHKNGQQRRALPSRS